MNMGENCQKCRFLMPYANTENNGGYCRRYPAQLAVIGDSQGDSTDFYYEQPVVTVNDWCGEFKDKAKKE